MRSSSSAFSHLATTTVATPLPTRLVSARASDMKRSTPRISAMLATGMVPTDASVAASTMKPDPVTPAAPFEVSRSTPMMPSCCHKRQLGVGRLREEDRRHGQVDAGAIQVEGVAGRDHQAHDRLLAAEVLELGDHARQHRLGRRGAEHDQQLFLDVPDELEDVEPCRATRSCPARTARRSGRSHRRQSSAARATAACPRRTCRS